MFLYFIYWLIVPILVEPASSAKILGVSPVVGGSHYIVIRNVMEELASRGHEVRLRAYSTHVHTREGDGRNGLTLIAYQFEN